MKETNIATRSLRQRQWTAYLVFVVLLVLGYAGWKWLRQQPATGNGLGGIPAPLRRGLGVNERLSGTLFRPQALVQTYAKTEAVKKVRFNGALGLRTVLDSAGWRLKVARQNGDTAYFTLAAIQALPKTEIVYDFKCIEGWSQRTWWGGVQLSAFLKHFGLEGDAHASFAGFLTPDGAYYVGIDMPSALHPQTLLCYEMNGKPLPLTEGYPLRLIIPVKYGIKNIKRIGTLYFSNSRPRDYWAERGYDYYSGH